MPSCMMDGSCWKQVMRGMDDGGEFVVTGNKMLKGGDERPHGMWWVVSFSPPRCEFYTS